MFFRSNKHHQGFHFVIHFGVFEDCVVHPCLVKFSGLKIFEDVISSRTQLKLKITFLETLNNNNKNDHFYMKWG